MLKPIQNQDQVQRSDVVSEHKNHELRSDQYRMHSDQQQTVKEAHLKQSRIDESNSQNPARGGGHKSPDQYIHRNETDVEAESSNSVKIKPNGGQILDQLA